VNVFLYGPPGAGKSYVGRLLARRLHRAFVDLDDLIVSRTGRSIESWFRDGEPAFRAVEAQLCRELAGGGEDRIVALGAGALLDAGTRTVLARDHLVICLSATAGTLAARLRDGAVRPLLSSGGNQETALAGLLSARAGHYESFPERIDTDGRRPDEVIGFVLSILRPQTLSLRRLRQHVILGYGVAADLPSLVAHQNLGGPFVVVTDEHVRTCQPSRLPPGWPVVVVPPGESSKTFEQLARLSRAFVSAGLDRRGTVVAVGGGVIGDLAGFAAATFMRGVRWISVPTSLVAMIDASIGGKTGIDLPEGKNLVGVFHPAAIVAVDPLCLGTLPAREWTAGMAEVIKHAIVGDPALFASLERGRPFGALADFRAAIEVKRAVVARDPFERGEREVLNLGHTIGHGVEAASGYELRHGEAVAIGLAGEARLAERLGLAPDSLAGRIESVLAAAGLPTRYSGPAATEVRAAMSADKKTALGRLRFALPADVGHVERGVEVPEDILLDVLNALRRERTPA
jgi:shikimate kinase/3-dehydroquinate synthase